MLIQCNAYNGDLHQRRRLKAGQTQAGYKGSTGSGQSVLAKDHQVVKFSAELLKGSPVYPEDIVGPAVFSGGAVPRVSEK